jgi:uncharacterized protein YuzE
MKIKYFSDTDTALMEFSEKEVVETREVSENIYVDLDENGNLVSMTVEHAKERASLPQVDVEEIRSA